MKAYFIGCEKRESKNKNVYHMLYVGTDCKDGYGVRPMTFKISANEYKDFEGFIIGSEISDISYEVVQEMSGNYRFILKRYTL